MPNRPTPPAASSSGWPRGPAASLAQIGYGPALVVTLAFPRDAGARPLRGSGFLVPEAERRPLIACTYASASRKWPHASAAGALLLRCYLGGPHLAELLTRADADLTALVCAELSDVLGLATPPLLARVSRWPAGIPRYTVGHLERVHQAEQALESLPGVVLAGAAYHCIGVSDCLRQAEAAARAALARARRPARTVS